MPLSMHQACAPMFAHSLKALSHILDLAQAAVDEGRFSEAELLEARLAPDMFPLPRQVQIASDVVKTCLARLSGREPPVWPDEEKTLAELRQRVAKSLDYLQGFPASEIDGSEERPIRLTFRNPQGEGEMSLDFTGQSFLQTFVIPNFYFHMTTTYAILRHKGLALSKRDFLSGE